MGSWPGSVKHDAFTKQKNVDSVKHDAFTKQANVDSVKHIMLLQNKQMLILSNVILL